MQHTKVLKVLEHAKHNSRKIQDQEKQMTPKTSGYVMHKGNKDTWFTTLIEPQKCRKRYKVKKSKWHLKHQGM